MKSLNKQAFRAEVSEAREEAFCSNPDCGERFHISELVNLNEKYDNLNYCSLVCVPCQKGIHLVVEAKTILKNKANENNS
jgi:hypothetical protein